MNQQSHDKRSLNTNIGYGIGYSLLICFIIGGVVGYLQHDFERWLSTSLAFGVGLGVLGGLIADRISKRKAM